MLKLLPLRLLLELEVHNAGNQEGKTEEIHDELECRSIGHVHEPT